MPLFHNLFIAPSSQVTLLLSHSFKYASSPTPPYSVSYTVPVSHDPAEPGPYTFFLLGSVIGTRHRLVYSAQQYRRYTRCPSGGGKTGLSPLPVSPSGPQAGCHGHLPRLLPQPGGIPYRKHQDMVCNLWRFRHAPVSFLAPAGI